MIQMQTVVEVADNSGAKRLRCIGLVGGSKGKYAGLGDVITASVKEATPDGTVKKGKVVKAVIVRTVAVRRRRDGSYIRFDQNAAVLINDNREPVGTRVPAVCRARRSTSCDFGSIRKILRPPATGIDMPRAVSVSSTGARGIRRTAKMTAAAAARRSSMFTARSSSAVIRLRRSAIWTWSRPTSAIRDQLEVPFGSSSRLLLTR